MRYKTDEILKICFEKLKYFKYAESSINTYIHYILGFLEFTKKNYQHLTSNDFQFYLDSYNFTSVSQQNQIISSIKFLYKRVLNKKYNKIDFTRPRKEKKLPIVHSQAEMQLLFNACVNLKHKVIISILYSCGLRVSELINLKWENIDRYRGVINIIQSKGKKDRIVMLNKKLIPLLEKYAREYKTKTYILKGQTKEKYTSSSVNQVLKQLSKKAGLDKRIYAHLIRHNCFTHMVENEIDIYRIQVLAGHEKPETTQIYTRLSNKVITKIESPLEKINF